MDLKNFSGFHSSTKVLMTTGEWKNIDTIESGDLVINKIGEHVKVISINKAQSEVISIQTTNWYTPTIVTKKNKYWIENTQYEEKWKSIGNILTNKNNCLLIPKKIKWKSTCFFENFDEDDAYDLGYLIGVYLASINFYVKKVDIIHWYFCNYEYTIYISDMLHSVFDIYFKNDGNSLIIVNEDVCSFFKHLHKDKDNTKYLPSFYYLSNTDYIKGILDGLCHCFDFDIDSDIFSTRNQHLAEVFIWCCLSLGYNYMIESSNTFYELKKIISRNRQLYNYAYVTYIEELEQIVDVYNIEVETGSFIANGCVVQS